jgi:hypothetical protein
VSEERASADDNCHEAQLLGVVQQGPKWAAADLTDRCHLSLRAPFTAEGQPLSSTPAANDTARCRLDPVLCRRLFALRRQLHASAAPTVMREWGTLCMGAQSHMPAG